ncbi:MAG TPA: hypothetical protein DCQ06_10405 [Myxococcales bacterium]|nr:hypothetical protein [Myxococcales bacterium]HAN31997.1 hypothetical protein [Myxococcales bacterium]
MMFVGVFTQRMDAKGRVSVPAAIRQEFDGDPLSLVLVPTFDGNCPSLRIYPKTIYAEQVQSQLDTLKRRHAQVSSDTDKAAIVKETNRFLKVAVQNADSVRLDGIGRFVLNQRIRSALEVDAPAELVFVGTMNHVRVYEISRWKELDAELAPTSAEQSSYMTEMDMHWSAS